MTARRPYSALLKRNIGLQLQSSHDLTLTFAPDFLSTKQGRSVPPHTLRFQNEGEFLVLGLLSFFPWSKTGASSAGLLSCVNLACSTDIMKCRSTFQSLRLGLDVDALCHYYFRKSWLCGSVTDIYLHLRRQVFDRSKGCSSTRFSHFNAIDATTIVWISFHHGNSLCIFRQLDVLL